MRPGERLTLAMTALGPAFVKLGQALSVRPDLVGDTLADDLRSLQDNLPAFSGAQARAIDRDGAERHDRTSCSDSFDDTAIAAASIAQVHKATTPDGDAVAVKLLRPGIEAAFARDLDLALWAAQRVQNPAAGVCTGCARSTPSRTIIRSVEMEMDLRFEAAAADELRQNFRRRPDVLGAGRGLAAH